MGKAPISDSIMPAARMKSILAMSKTEPVQAAICLSSDGEGLMLLDKKAKPKKVASMLRAAAAKAKIQLNMASLRFGRAEVDTEYDASMVRLFVNKETPGNMRLKLVEVVKQIPYQKVEINVDPSLELEPEEDEVEGAAPVAAQAATPVPAAPALPAPARPDPALPDPALAVLHAELVRLIPDIAKAPAAAVPALKAQAGLVNTALRVGDVGGATAAMARLKSLFGAATAPTGARPVSADGLQKELVGLIGRIGAAAGNDATVKAVLARLAGDANAALKSGDLAAAAARLGQLRDALAPAPAVLAPAAVDTSAWRAARQAWQDANDAVNEQINALRLALRAQAKDGDTEGMEGMAEALGVIAENGLNAITEDHRVKLMAVVMDLGGGDAAAMAKHGAKALGLMAAFKTFVDGSEKIEVCDGNPFDVPVSIRGTLSPVLSQMAQAVQTAMARG